MTWLWRDILKETNFYQPHENIDDPTGVANNTGLDTAYLNWLFGEIRIFFVFIESLVFWLVALCDFL